MRKVNIVVEAKELELINDLVIDRLGNIGIDRKLEKKLIKLHKELDKILSPIRLAEREAEDYDLSTSDPIDEE